MHFTGTYSKPQWKNTYLTLHYNSKCYKVVGLEIMLQINIPTLDSTLRVSFFPIAYKRPLHSRIKRATI